MHTLEHLGHPHNHSKHFTTGGVLFVNPLMEIMASMYYMDTVKFGIPDVMQEGYIPILLLLQWNLY